MKTHAITILLFLLLGFKATPALADTLYANTEEVVDTTNFSFANDTVSEYNEYETEANEEPKLATQDIVLPLTKYNRNISEADWQKLTADKAFRYNEEAEKPSKLAGFIVGALAGFGAFMASPFGKIIVVVLLVLLVAFIVMRILKINAWSLFGRKNVKHNTNDFLGENNEDDVLTDWNKAIADALQAGNTRLAVRHAYRQLLLQLSDKNIIVVQKDKTNYQYAKELAGTSFYRPFLQIIREFEYAWYGGFSISRQQFDAYYKLVNNFRNSLP